MQIKTTTPTQRTRIFKLQKQKQEITNFGEALEKLESLCSADGTAKRSSHRNRWMVPQKVNTDVPSGPPTTPGNIPKRREDGYSKEYTHTHVLISTTPYSQTKCPLVDKQTTRDVSIRRNTIQPLKRQRSIDTCYNMDKEARHIRSWIV